MESYFSRKAHYLALNMEFSNLLELFLVFAVTSLLAVRAYLSFTGYPKIGSGNFHIAHMLWGGLFMMVAIFLLLMFLNKKIRRAAAIVGGIGFGTFIDELGKFITSDNNYFYRPAVAVIYLIFVFLFFALRAAEKRAKFSQQDHAINAIEEVKEFIIDDLDEQERQKALSLLEQSDQSHPVVAGLTQILQKASGRAVKAPGYFSKFKRALHYVYIKLVRTVWFSQFVILFFAVFAGYNFLSSLWGFRSSPDYADFGEFFSALLTAALIARGIKFLKSGTRIKAYQSFKNAVLVSIFLTQFFLFVKEQFSALIGLVLCLLAFAGCQYLIAEEEIANKTPAASLP